MRLHQIYQKLLEHFGKQHWWPAETRFEVIIGAILIQQTNWRAVEYAIENLKSEGLLNPTSLATASLERVQRLIRNLNFYRQKARRIVNFSRHLVERHDGSLDKLFGRSIEEVRKELLSLDGIGKETADSILLYAVDMLVFPVDAYTVRMCERLGCKDLKYEELRNLFERNLPEDLEAYKEFHALIDKLGKMYYKAKPRCSGCPLTHECHLKVD